MYKGVLDLHSYWAIAVLFLLFLAMLNAFAGLSAKRPFQPRDRQIAMLALAFAHVQFVIGLVLIFVSPLMDAAKAEGMAAVMHDGHMRLILVEHPLVNLIAITLITIGWSKHKKAVDASSKFKKIGYFYVAGLLLLLSRIPWSQWLS
jgi:hypothetical protein